MALDGGKVLDKKNEELIDAGIFEQIEGKKQLSPEIEKAINDKVEESFQEFLKSEEYLSIKDSGTKEAKQLMFNGWLDQHVNPILEDAKIQELISYNKDIVRDLENLKFELSDDFEKEDKGGEEISSTETNEIKEKENAQERYELLSSLNLSQKEIEDKKRYTLDGFCKLLTESIGGWETGIGVLIEHCFAPGGTITYKNEIINIKDLCKKINDGTIDRNIISGIKNANVTRSEYAHVADVKDFTTGNDLHIVETLIQNITISEKTENTSSGTEGSGETTPVVTRSVQTETEGTNTEAEENDTKIIEGYAKSKLGRAIGSLYGGKTEASEVMKLFATSGSTVTYKNENMSAEEFLNKVKKKEIKMTELNNLTFDVTLAENSTPENPIIKSAIFSENAKDGKENTEQNKSTADVQITYDTDKLIEGLKKTHEDVDDLEALDLLLGLNSFIGITYVRTEKDKGLSTNLEGYEIKGQEKKDLKELRNALRLFAKGHETQITISDFFRLASEQYTSGEPFDLSKLGKEPSNTHKHGGTKDKYEKFCELYAKYRREEGGPYFRRTMGIMENYFLRGDVDSKSIKDLYKMEQVGTWEGFVDPDKEKEVFKGLFEGNSKLNIDLGVAYAGSEELKNLKKIVKKIDINELFQSGKLEGKGNNLDKREKQFYDLYKLYKDNKLVGNDYYKKVFEFIVSVGRGNTTLVDTINAINLTKAVDKVSFDEGKEGEDGTSKEKSKDKIHYNSEEEKRFILLLSDFNHDARTDANDSGLKMGQQIRNIYKSVNIDLNNAGLDDQIEDGGHIWNNIVDFAKQYFKNISDPNMSAKLDNINTITDLNNKIKEDPTILIALQNMLKNSSISINSIFRYGDKASEMFMKELMQDQKIDEQYDQVFEGLVTQGVNPTAKQALKPIILGSLMDNSVGIGLGAAYDAGKVGSFSAVLGVSDVPGMGETVGLVVGYGNSIPAGDKRTIDLGASGGVSYNGGFVPMFSVYAGTSVRVSDGLMNKDFDATTLTKIHAGANFTMIGTIPSWGVSTGVSMDKLSGIDKQESILRPNITEVVSEFLNDEEITGIIFKNKEITDEQKEKCINNIREKLGNKYGKMDEDLLDKAANNIYKGFAYYAAETDLANKSENDQKTIKNKILNNIVNNYVTQRRNDKIEELNGTTQVSDVTVGVQFLVDYWPIPMAGVTFTKYSNLYSRETPESIAEYESILSNGQGMGYLEHSVEEDTGNITRKAIDYLNEKMSIASKYNLEKMQIRFDSLDESDEANNIIFIPRELCNSINISVDPKMKDYIKSDDEGFKIPLNSQLSLLTYTRTDATKFNLIIGDHKKENDDIEVNIKSKFEGNPLKYEYKEGKYVTTKYKINADMETLYGKEGFPLSKCTEIKENKLYFETTNDNISCIGSNVEIKEGKLIIPANADLKITRKIDGSYIAECKTISSETHVTYIDEKKISETKQEKSLGNLFEGYNELNDMFNGLEKKLSLMDNRNYQAYTIFMNAAAEYDIEGKFDEGNYEEAFKSLKKILKRLPDSDLKNAINDENISLDKKVMIVDRFKAIFSYNDRLTNKHNLECQLSGRKDTYKNLYGYDRTTPFPLGSDFDYRKAVQERLNAQGNFEKKPNPNLIGMTAFYRLGEKNSGRSYMMTELGGTSVLGGEMIPITDTNDLSKTKEWFRNNLNKSGVHKELLKTALAQKLETILKIDGTLKLDDNDLISLLQGEDIDIGSKKVKINTKYVFYLLGECANESIGIDLGTDGENVIIHDNEITDITIKPELTYEGVSGVYTGSAEAMSRYEIGYTNSATLGFAVGKGKKTETEEHITKPNGGDDDQHQTNPNGNSDEPFVPGDQDDPEVIPQNIEGDQNDAEVIPTGTTTNVNDNKITTTTVIDAGDEYIKTTTEQPLPAHEHPFTASQSEENRKSK